VRTEGALRVKAAAPPSAVEELVTGALRPLVGALGGGAAVVYPTLGLAFASGAVPDAAAAVRAVDDARRALAARGGHLVLQAAPGPVRERCDPWGPPPPALAVMRRVKEQLDPEGRLAPGRFVGGI
jgi:glycolate oxidase FAD binding subunit